MTIALPAPEYDALKASVDRYGIGAGRYYTFSATEHGTGDWIPCCFIGHYDDCFGSTRIPEERYGISATLSDMAVIRINRSRGKRPSFGRVTWDEFATELEIVRSSPSGDFSSMSPTGDAESCDVSAHDSSVRCDRPTPFDVSRVVGSETQRA